MYAESGTKSNLQFNYLRFSVQIYNFFLIYAKFFVLLYRVCMICTDLHSCLSSLLADYSRDQTVLLYDSRVLLEQEFLSLSSLRLALECDEAHKSLTTVQHIWDFLLEHQITRRGVMVAVGGGVLTDLAGFAAATYKRGIAYINVPTTLLAMVDASTGGKTGFNYGGLKNAVGAFYPPVETLIYPPFLATLPPHEFLSGFAEMLKTGLIESTEYRIQSTDRLWDRLLVYDPDAMPTDTLTPLIAECIAVKEHIVAADPTEKNLRKALNFGHTFGHALEEMSFVHRTSSLSLPCGEGRGEVPHGYAVLYGMIAELYLSAVLLDCPREPLQQLTQLMLRYYGRPQCSCSDREQLIELMRRDKKNEHASEINCTLLRGIGEPVVNQTITDEEAAEAWDYLFSL